MGYRPGKDRAGSTILLGGRPVGAERNAGIEVQLGSYLGEDDIIRADDVYKRAPEETK